MDTAGALAAGEPRARRRAARRPRHRRENVHGARGPTPAVVLAPASIAGARVASEDEAAAFAAGRLPGGAGLALFLAPSAGVGGWLDHQPWWRRPDRGQRQASASTDSTHPNASRASICMVAGSRVGPALPYPRKSTASAESYEVHGSPHRRRRCHRRGHHTAPAKRAPGSSPSSRSTSARSPAAPAAIACSSSSRSPSQL